MPVIHVDILKRGPEAKRALVAALTKATVESLGVAPETVWVVVNEMEMDQFATAGTLHADRAGA